MSGQDTRVGVVLTADGKVFVNGVRVAGAEYEKFVKGVEAGSKRTANAVEEMRGLLSGAAKIGGGLFALHEVKQYAMALGEAADAATNVRSRLALVAGTAQNTSQVYQALFQTAQESRVGFADLAGTYAQMARSTEELGISQDRLLAVTRTLSQAVTVSGGSAQSAQAAMVQLSQGLASGTLRGEELNSILEQTPRVAQAIAQGLGVSIGALRKLGEEGKLTAEAVIGALERSAPAIQAEFARMSPTIGQAFTTLANSSVNLIGTLDEITGTSRRAAEGIRGIGGAIDWVAARARENPAAVRGAFASMFSGGIGPQAQIMAFQRAQLEAQAASQARGDTASDDIMARRAADAAREQARRDSGRAFATDRRVLTPQQRRIAEINELSGEYVRAVSRLGDSASEDDLAALRGALQQGIANINEKYKEKAPAGARAGVADRRQAQAAEIADRRAAVQFLERLEIASIESLGRQRIRSEEDVARDRARIRLQSIERQEGIAREALGAAGTDQSDAARAQGELTELARERLQVEVELSQRLAELGAERQRQRDQETAEFAARQIAREGEARREVEVLEQENQARLRAIATGQDYTVTLQEMKVARLEAAVAGVEQDDVRLAQLLAEIELEKRRLAAIRERLSIENQSRDHDRQERAAERAAEDLLRSVKDREQYISRSITDALVRGFENGKGAAENLRDAMRNIFRATILEPTIRPIAEGVSRGASALIDRAIGSATDWLFGPQVSPAFAAGPDESPAETARLLRTKGAGGPGSVTVVVPQTYNIGTGVDAQQAQAILRTGVETTKAEIGEYVRTGGKGLT